jgi:hypothetical protein
MLCVRRKEKVDSFSANLAEIKNDFLSNRILWPELVSSTTQNDIRHIKVIPEQDVGVGKVNHITQPMKMLNLGLKHLTSFLMKLAQGQKIIPLIELIRLDIMNAGMFVGPVFRSKRPIVCQEIIGSD